MSTTRRAKKVGQRLVSVQQPVVSGPGSAKRCRSKPCNRPIICSGATSRRPSAYAAAHDIGVLVYGPLAHGLLSGGITGSTSFAPQDWRSRSDMFTGDQFRRNLRAVSELARIAAEDLGVPVSRLAVAWTLANPAVHTAIVGTRNPAHIDDAIAAADLDLGTEVVERIDSILTSAAATAGPTPDSV